MVPWRVYCAKPYGTLVPEWATTTQCTVDTHTHTHPPHTQPSHTHTRVGQYVLQFRFFNVFTMRQAHLLPKVLKQANFR